MSTARSCAYLEGDPLIYSRGTMHPLGLNQANKARLTLSGLVYSITSGALLVSIRSHSRRYYTHTHSLLY